MDPYSNEFESDEPEEIYFLDSDGVRDAAPVAPEVPSVYCWRCRKPYPHDLLNCAYCGAENRARHRNPFQHFEKETPKNGPLKIVLVTYGIMLIGSILMAMHLRYGIGLRPPNQSDFTGAITFLEVIDTIIVLVAMGFTGLALSRIDPVPSIPTAAASWLFFGLGLAGMIMLNFGYHKFLIELLGIPKAEGMYPDSWVVLIVLFCVQPAIVEELFARQMSLAVLRKHMGVHFSVFITSLMFAMMHIFVPLSVPYLFMLGVFLGYARVLGGTVFLPMVLHFVHNLVVIIYDKS